MTSETRIVIAVILAAVLVWIWKANQRPFTGQVSTGWASGNAGGNLPGSWSLTNIVGQASRGIAQIFSPPGVGYGPSTTTNQGSTG